MSSSPAAAAAAGASSSSSSSSPALPPLIDCGANLTDATFRGVYHGKRWHDDDLDAVLQRAWDHGMQRIMVTAGCLDDVHHAAALCKRDRRLFYTVGVHPTRAKEFEKRGGASGARAHLEALLACIRADRERVCAVGELGLDYDRTEFCPIDTQRRYFDMQFELAEATGLPLFLHDRNTGSDFLDAIRAHRGSFKDGLVHSFTGTVDEARALLDLGLAIGLNGCSLKTEANLDVVRMLPADRIMLETDAPYCEIRNTHASARFLTKATAFKTVKKERYESGALVRSRCEPCMIRQVLEVVAKVRGVDEHELAVQAYRNTMRMFFPDAPLA